MSSLVTGKSKRLRLFGALRAVCLLAVVAGACCYFFWPRAAESNAGRTATLQSPPPGASVSVRVGVSSSMRSSPFDVDRYLTVPPSFSISVYARVPNARFMAVAPNGDLFVSRPGAGEVKLVRPSTTGGDPVVSTFVSGLRNPHDVVFHTIGGTTYVYIAESHQINRYVYNYGDTTAQNRQVIITGLPDSSSSELGGSHGHQLKNIALDSNNKLYVSSASATNASPTDVTSNPPRAAIFQYDSDGANGRVFARGLRNAEGLAILPGTNELWVAVNNRDNIAYPFHNDWNGDGTDDYGKVMQSYVDNHPPEEFTRVRDGGNYGWPYANPNPDTASGLDNMPFDLDVQNNANGQYGTVDSFDRITKGIQAHSAPLGLSFLQGTNFPALYRDGAVIGLHGSWNRAVKTGYKIAYFPWNNVTQSPGAQLDLVTGWLTSGGAVWGRPVDAVVDVQGNLLISDDQSGTIYKLTYSAAPTPTPTPTPAQTVTSFTLINADTDQPLAAHNPMSNGATLDFAVLGTRNLSIRANTNPATVGSVLFGYDGNANYRTESSPPYTIAGDANNGADYLPWTPTLGSHTLTATPYTATGTAGTALTINFTVIDGATPAPPADPSGLSAMGISGPGAKLTWTDNANNETGFSIQRCSGSSSCADFSDLTTVGAGVTTYSDTGLSGRTWYRYRVRAYNAGGPSAYSNVAGVRTPRR